MAKNTGVELLLPPNLPGHTPWQQQWARTQIQQKTPRQTKPLNRQALKGTFRWARLWITSNLPLPEEGELKWKFGCSRQGPKSCSPTPGWVDLSHLLRPTALPQGQSRCGLWSRSWGRVCRVYPLLTEETVTATELREALQRKLLAGIIKDRKEPLQENLKNIIRR